MIWIVSEAGTASTRHGIARVGTAPSLSGRLLGLLIAALLAALAVYAPRSHAADRAYEMVSPVDKNGAEVRLDTVTAYAAVRVAPDGNAVAYPLTTALPAGPSGAPIHQWISTRAVTGWSTRSVSPPMAAPDNFFFAGVSFLSSDLSRAVVFTNTVLTEEAEALQVEFGLYLQDHSTTPPSYTLVSRPSEPNPRGATYRFQGASEGLRHVLFTSNTQLLPEDTSAGDGLYEWANGELRLVGIMPSDEVADSAEIGARNVGVQEGLYPGGHPVSEDGSRIYFTATGSALYLREGGTQTIPVSVSERTEDDPNVSHAAEFLLATANGSIAFFRSSTKLTDNATASGNNCTVDGLCDLYRWDREAPRGDRLTDLTTRDPDGGGVLGAVGGADDGSHVYFVATGDLAAGATSGAPNLYLWRAGEGVRHVATLDAGDGPVWGIDRKPGVDDHYRAARISDDGQRLLFVSRAPLTQFATAGDRQVYLYDAPTDQITCVSCSQLSKSAPTAGAALFQLPSESTFALSTPRVLPRNLSADGERAFFQTRQRLVRADTNGRIDVYEWEDGNLSLVSDGQSAEDAKFIGADARGRDAYFITRAQLVPRDRDNAADVYDGRVGGGFPQPLQAEPCVGDQCLEPLTDPPGDLAPGSSTFDGPGNRSAGDDRRAERCTKLHRRHDRAKRKAKKLRHKARRLKRGARRADGRRARKLRHRSNKTQRRAKQQRRKSQQAKRRAKRQGCELAQASRSRSRCERLDQRAHQAKRRLRQARRKARSADGRRIRRLERKLDERRQRARRLERRARRCERGAS